ncbi:MAG: transcription-repair coupling factor [Acidiferrobacteraceae bacterium]
MANPVTAPAEIVRASPFSPPLPDDGRTLGWQGLEGSARGLALAAAARVHPGPLLIVTADARHAQQLEEEIRFYGGPDSPVLVLPDWESLPYDAFSPHHEIVSERLRTLSLLPTLTRGVVIATVTALMHRLAPRQHIEALSFSLADGDRLQRDAFRDRLIRVGYRAVSQVSVPGEFSVRGGLIDVFPMGNAAPLRVELFDDRVDSIRSFDPETQRSLIRFERIDLLPGGEYPATDDAIQRFRTAFRAEFEGDPQRRPLYRDVSNGLHPAGIEYYLPLFFAEMAKISDYLPEHTLCVIEPSCDEAVVRFEHEAHARYDALRHDRERPILAPNRVFLGANEFAQMLDPFARIVLGTAPGARHAVVDFTAPAPPALPMRPKDAQPYHLLFEYLSRHPGRVLLVAETAGRREALRELLADGGFTPQDCDNWAAFHGSSLRLALTCAALDRGLALEHPALAIVTESQLYGEHVVQRRRRAATRDVDHVIRDLADIKPGDPVVHEEHGVGRYLGLQSLDVGDGRTEFLTLEYAGGDKLYAPVTALNLIHRYTATHPDQAPLHRLGTETWDRTRARAREKARDAAVELLELYARRAARTGHAFRVRDDRYRVFAAAFPFEETPDQARVIDEVLTDMESARPMDRLVCGDVGFGKTEVAMRAAFLAVRDRRQVAVLVPTTLLVQQHFQNFRDRFSDTGTRIESLSRFRSPAEQRQVLDQLSSGGIDIVIGTHRLLQSDVRFKDLGLVIIDEEHRFGVRQKERLKSLRSEVDILTLTATPVPRTLNLALSALRDISLIATPPQERLSVKTFVTQWSDTLIREACLRELRRGGQVYFLHNDVKTIVRAEQQLKRLVPEAEIRVAHGQMPERTLERVMLDFYHRRFNILVCSTIIETGIDVPTANTIIIERADKFGLAQMHQLRGRVGRSHHRAYAYLLVPPEAALTADARKRLDAIGSLEELGAGFALASHDLEIRGAGELLGETQSGQIDDIGFTLYAELLARAVQSLRSGEDNLALDARSTDINLHAPALLPEDYVPDAHVRLILYKRISAARDEEDLRELQVELIDRFGLLPGSAKLLLRVASLKRIASPLGIVRIEAGPKGIRIEFDESSKVDPGRLITLMQSRPGYRLDGRHLRLKIELPSADARIASLQMILSALGASAPG